MNYQVVYRVEINRHHGNGVFKMGGKNLKVEDAAKLLGVKVGAVYKAISHHNIPGEKEIVNGKVEVGVPAVLLLKCIESKKSKLISKVKLLETSEQMLRRHIHG